MLTGRLFKEERFSTWEFAITLSKYQTLSHPCLMHDLVYRCKLIEKAIDSGRQSLLNF
jgi:hypothetical protein